MQQKTRKPRKLAVQVSLIIAVTAIVILYLVGSVVVDSTRKMYIESHNDQIRQELEDVRYLFMKPAMTAWMLDRWEQNAEAVLDFEKGELNQDENTLFLMRLIADSEPEEFPEMLEGDDLVYYLQGMYKYILNRFNGMIDEGRFDSVLILDVRHEDGRGSRNDGYYVVMDCGGARSQTGGYGLGSCISAGDTYLFLQSLRDGNVTEENAEILFQTQHNRRKNTLLYMAGLPVFLNGTLRYVICLEYNWSSFARLLDTSLDHIARWGILSVLGISFLLYLFIYRKAVRPLTMVNDGMLAYMETKDSEASARNMEKIRENNEIGMLAGSFAALTRELDRYHRENLQLSAERERVRTEMELATRIQADSLPTDLPDRPEFLLAASMDPAKEVGGDFYDFYFIDETRLGLVIADVSGKSVPAALFMMMAKIIIRNYAMMGLSPAEVLSRANDSLCEHSRNGMFVTVWMGILDIATGHVTACSAGHEYPMLRKAGRPFVLFREPHGVPLGIMKQMPYRNYEFDLGKGGTLFVYTDGAPEATNAQEQLFGTERMLEALNREADAAPDRLQENLIAAISDFVKDAPQFDDTTMLCVRMEKDARADQPGGGETA